MSKGRFSFYDKKSHFKKISCLITKVQAAAHFDVTLFTLYLFLPQMSGCTEASECSVTDMQKGKSYRYRVCARNRHGKGKYVEFAEVILAKDPPRCPDAPRNLTYSNVKKESISIGWSTPKYDGGSPVSGEDFMMNLVPAN